MSVENTIRMLKEQPETLVRRGSPQERLGPHSGNNRKGNRLKGSARRERQRDPKLTRWIPKEWKPVYEEIIQLDAAGIDQEVIAAKYNFTKAHVSNICRTPHAKIIRAGITKRLIEAGAEAPQTRIKRIAEKAMSRVEKIITDDDIFANAPFAVADRSARFLKTIGVFGREESSVIVNNYTQNNTTNQVNEKMVVVLNNGLDKLKKIDGIHGKARVLSTQEPKDVVYIAPVEEE
jgi:hypothetical protein